MKKILQASLSAVLVLSLVGCGSTKDEAIYQDLIDDYVNEIDMDYAYDFTKTLSTDTSLHDNSLGFRTSGSDAEHRTANYLAKEMKAIGLKNVEKIPFKKRVIIWLSDFYSWICGKKEEDNLGNCTYCGCSIFYASGEEFERCKLGKWDNL